MPGTDPCHQTVFRRREIRHRHSGRQLRLRGLLNLFCQATHLMLAVIHFSAEFKSNLIHLMLHRITHRFEAGFQCLDAFLRCGDGSVTYHPLGALFQSLQTLLYLT